MGRAWLCREGSMEESLAKAKRVRVPSRTSGPLTLSMMTQPHGRGVSLRSPVILSVSAHVQLFQEAHRSPLALGSPRGFHEAL